jgi:hypothetical protein
MGLNLQDRNITLLKDILGGPGKIPRCVLLCATAICMLLIAAPVLADEKYPSDQTADENPYVLQPSESPTPDTWIPKLRVGDQNRYAEIYGWLNKGLLVHDDGASTQTYFPVDNDAGSSRAGFRLRALPNDKWTLGINGELE